MALHGVINSIGHRKVMEDFYVFAEIAPDVRMYGVFDGHGGSEVASILASDLHKAVSHQYAVVHDAAHALTEAFSELDACTMHCDDGSTATVALITDEAIVVAHCGDCRAVLKRNDDIIQLTVDHRPDNASERARIQECGGIILHYHGEDRVMGLLGMTRAFGDKYFRPMGVVSDPDVLTVVRSESDEFLLLASDGLFEAFSTDDAIDVAKRALSRAEARGLNTRGRCRVAANVLNRMARERGAHDNITVIVILLNEKTI